MQELSGQDVQPTWNLAGLQSPTWSDSDSSCLYDGWQHDLISSLSLSRTPLSPVSMVPMGPASHDFNLDPTLSQSLSPGLDSEELEDHSLFSPQVEVSGPENLAWPEIPVTPSLPSLPIDALTTVPVYLSGGAAGDGSQPYYIPTPAKDVALDPRRQEMKLAATKLWSSKPGTVVSSASTSTSTHEARGTRSDSSTPRAGSDKKRKCRASSHNQTERKYRSRINQQFQLLSETLCLDRRQSSSDDESRGVSKAELLAAATRRIRGLEQDLDSQARQIKTLKCAIQSLRATTGCPEAPVAPWEAVL